MLELCCDGDRLIPSMSYGLPLSPAADSCRTARHALTLIATARPAAFITTMVREVARYNTLQQNAQALNVNLANTVLARAKPEILRVIELLMDKMQAEIIDLLVEVRLSKMLFINTLSFRFNVAIESSGHGYCSALPGPRSPKKPRPVRRVSGTAPLQPGQPLCVESTHRRRCKIRQPGSVRVTRTQMSGNAIPTSYSDDRLSRSCVGII